MPSEQSGGTQAAVIGTEHTLATITVDGIYQLEVDTDPMVGGTTPDFLELRAKIKTRTGESSKQVYYACYLGDQGAEDVIKVSLPVVCVEELVFTLKQTTGTGRTFTWSIKRVDA